MHERKQLFMPYRNFCQAPLLLSHLTLSDEIFQCGWTLVEKGRRMPPWGLGLTKGWFTSGNPSRILEHLSYNCVFWGPTSMLFSHMFILIVTIRKRKQSCDTQDFPFIWDKLVFCNTLFSPEAAQSGRWGEGYKDLSHIPFQGCSIKVTVWIGRLLVRACTLRLLTPCTVFL